MKVPVSKQMVNFLLLPCISVVGVSIFDLIQTGQQKANQNILLTLLFGIPSILFTWFLLNKRVVFKDNAKAAKTKRFLNMPFPSKMAFAAIIVGFLFLIAGLTEIIGNKNETGLPMLLISLLTIIVSVFFLEHSKIGFSDTINIQDALASFKTANPSSLQDEDGIFAYHNGLFSVCRSKEVKIINWADIILINAYKQDLFTIDRIIIEIVLTESIISINDQTPGYMKFMETAAQQLPQFKKDWFMMVAFPAFENNPTIIYKKIGHKEA